MAKSSTSSIASAEPKQLIAPPSDENITEQPKPALMDMSRSVADRETITTFEDNESGYHRESNECTEFCMDFFMCFGACDSCCPLSGEGFFSGAAAFCGNLCISLRKC